MAGTKLKQTKDALHTILSDMRPGDKFNIISFSNQIDILDRYKMVDVNPNNINYAKAYVNDLREQDGKVKTSDCCVCFCFCFVCFRNSKGCVGLMYA